MGTLTASHGIGAGSKELARKRSVELVQKVQRSRPRRGLAHSAVRAASRFVLALAAGDLSRGPAYGFVGFDRIGEVAELCFFG
jgi:hypothetical protein